MSKKQQPLFCFSCGKEIDLSENGKISILFHPEGYKMPFCDRENCLISKNKSLAEIRKEKTKKHASKIYLLNSAVITSFGIYSYLKLEINELKDLLKNNSWESTIGYQETADALEKLTGIKIPVNRKQIKMKNGDQAIVFRLTKRLSDPSKKGSVSVQEILNNCEIGLLTRKM